MSIPQATEKKPAIGFPLFSSLRKIMSREDPVSPPSKEMKLENCRKHQYDEEKKMWVFEGEESEETKVVLPPPLTLLSASSPPLSMKSVHTAALEGKTHEKPYQLSSAENNSDAKLTQEIFN